MLVSRVLGNVGTANILFYGSGFISVFLKADAFVEYVKVCFYALQPSSNDWMTTMCIDPYLRDRNCVVSFVVQCDLCEQVVCVSLMAINFNV